VRNLLVFVVVAGIVGGGLYYVVRVRTPARDFSLARAEIERWEARANKVRGCLIGDKPVSEHAAEALAARELAGNPLELKKCTAAIGELSRGSAPDTGIKEVEDGWRGIGTAAAAVAAAFGHAFDPSPGARSRVIDELGDALDTLDVAQSLLRQAAGLEPEPTGIAKPSLPKAELIPLGGARRARLSAWLRPSAGGMVVLIDGGLRPQQLVLVPGEAPQRVPFQGGVRPSVTDARWGAQGRAGELVHGTVTGDGTLAESRARPLPDPAITPTVLFTVGDAANGAIAYLLDDTRATPRLAIARTAAGALELGTPSDADDYAFALAPPRRGLVAWSAKGALQAQLVTPLPPPPPPPPGATAPPAPPAPPRPVALGAGHAGLSCLTDKHAWITSGDQFVAFDGTRGATHELPGEELIGCDAAAVLIRDAGHRYAVCTVAAGDPPPAEPSCRVVELTAGAGAVPGLAGGQVVAVGVRHRVLAVWREGVAPRYFALPATFTPRLVHATAKVIDVVGEADAGLAIARVAL